MILKITTFWTWSTTLLILLNISAPVIIGYIYHYVQMIRWERKFLPKTGLEGDAFMNLYIATAVPMIKMDRRSKDEKKLLLQQRIESFGGNTEILWHNYSSILQREIRDTRLHKWSRKHLNTQQQEELIYLIIEFALMDGHFLQKEYDFIARFTKHLKIPKSELKSMLAAQRQRMFREEAERRNKTRERKKEKRTSESMRELALQVLGIPLHSDQGAIKKAYRTLVKKHHPDRFVNENAVVIEAAEARFIEIQKAYELLTA